MLPISLMARTCDLIARGIRRCDEDKHLNYLGVCVGVFIRGAMKIKTEEKVM